MADLLTIGSSAASTFQKAIEVTSNNTANVSTTGYSRQRAEIVSNTAGSNYVSGGSSVETVQRVYASYIQTQLVSANSGKSRYDEQLSLAQQLEGTLTASDSSVQTYLQNLFDAYQNLSSNPTDISARQNVISQNQSLQNMVNNMSSTLVDTESQVNDQISGLVNSVNTQLDVIKQINSQVAYATASSSQPPNDLLDKRDQAIMDLSKYMDVKTFTQSDGQILIYTGDGKTPLVSENTVNHLDASKSQYTDEGRTEVYMNIGGKKLQISDQIQGGQLGAVLDFRSNMLDKAESQLGVMLNGLVASSNWQNAQGYLTDGTNAQGGNIYNPLDATAIASTNNAGNVDASTIHVSIPTGTSTLTDVGQLTDKEYVVKYNGTSGNYDIYDRSDLTTSLGSVAAGSSGKVDGLTFDLTSLTGTPSNGDTFLVSPAKSMIDNFKLAFTDTKYIATSGIDPSTTTPASYSDNSNIANLASLGDKKLFFADSSGTATQSVMGAYSLMSTNVGNYVSTTQIQSTTQTNVYQQISDRRDSLSGVSLDEEAANLVKYQQAYQAAAQIIQTSKSLFDTLIGAIQ